MKLPIARMLAVFLILFNVNSMAAKGIEAGEAYVTRFSGWIDKSGEFSIDVNGIVGSIIDVRYPKVPPKGQHWIDEPQRVPIKAKDAGQVFGIAIDDSKPAIIYVTASSKFGLHRTKNNSDWMPGMWGNGGGPGTIYRLRAENNYQPEVFANITLDGRDNTGAALGNIAYDKIHKQLYVTDLETGMIHCITAKTGEECGRYDHGINGRKRFQDQVTNKVASLPVVLFSPLTKAKIKDCKTRFDTTPSCWNLADPRRRVWGIGVYSTKNGESRVYYAVKTNPQDRQSSIWSVGLNANGSFNTSDVRREFILPSKDGDKNLSVSDLAFSVNGEMLVAENGQLRNLGLGKIEPFSMPFDARLFLYSQNAQGIWALKGRYDVGNISKQSGTEFTNAAGGTDFGYGYTSDYSIDLAKVDEFVWVSGDALCSPLGPCFDLNTDSFTDKSEVHGIQGMPKTDLASSNGQEPDYLLESYMIDTDITYVDKNDATKIGDVEIAKTDVKVTTTPLHNTQLSAFHNKYESGHHNKTVSSPIHDKCLSHCRFKSHHKRVSHYRRGSHDLLFSHYRFGSHYRLDSHYRLWSHDRVYSHRKFNSHYRDASHAKYGSHGRRLSHSKYGSHSRDYSHKKTGSHNRTKSHAKYGSHSRGASHKKYGSHNRSKSHAKYGSHSRDKSHLKYGSHSRKRSHAKYGSHSRDKSHLKYGSHSRKRSHAKYGSHSRSQSHLKYGSHSRKRSHAKYGSHSRTRSHAKYGSHSRKRSHIKYGSHSRSYSHKKIGSHSRILSHAKKGSHSRTYSHKKYGSHSRISSHKKKGSHQSTPIPYNIR
jgi:hypothetical protein